MPLRGWAGHTYHLRMPKKLTATEFIERARKAHGDRYDYSLVDYVDNKTKVVIVCPVHGELEQSPNTHTSGGHGCQKCGGTARLDTQSFIDRARVVHGDKYDYSSAVYVDSKTKIKIICPEHGEFEQDHNHHVTNKHGCPRCTGNARSSSEEFTDRARAVHGDRYDYSKVNYINNSTKVTIICLEHGEFEQVPPSHLKGLDCQKCGFESISKSKTSNKEAFVAKAQEVHGDRYDYSKAVYLGATTNTTIICPEHGEFEQTPSSHYNGRGCPSCATSGIDVEAPGELYYLRVDTRTNTLWKIGITNRTVEERFIGADMKNITVVERWKYVRLGDALKREQEILNQHSGHLYVGTDEPLKKGGNTELFTRDVLGLDKDYS